jgi:ATP-binding cassette subfamily B (MDR/TAP) protein 1
MYILDDELKYLLMKFEQLRNRHLKLSSMESQEILLVDLQPAERNSSPAELIESQIHIEPCTANFFSLYRYTNASQILVLSISACCAVIAGVAMPLVTIIFGALAKEFINGDLKGQDDIRAQVQHLTLNLVYIGQSSFPYS